MKLIPKLIILLTKIQEKNIATIGGAKPKSVYCHRNQKGQVVGLLFKNENEEFNRLTIKKDYQPIDSSKE
jgi:hypothetical protein